MENREDRDLGIDPTLSMQSDLDMLLTSIDDHRESLTSQTSVQDEENDKDIIEDNADRAFSIDATPGNQLSSSNDLQPEHSNENQKNIMNTTASMDEMIAPATSTSEKELAKLLSAYFSNTKLSDSQVESPQHSESTHDIMSISPGKRLKRTHGESQVASKTEAKISAFSSDSTSSQKLQSVNDTPLHDIKKLYTHNHHIKRHKSSENHSSNLMAESSSTASSSLNTSKNTSIYHFQQIQAVSADILKEGSNSASQEWENQLYSIQQPLMTIFPKFISAAHHRSNHLPHMESLDSSMIVRSAGNFIGVNGVLARSLRRRSRLTSSTSTSSYPSLLLHVPRVFSIRRRRDGGPKSANGSSDKLSPATPNGRSTYSSSEPSEDGIRSHSITDFNMNVDSSSNIDSEKVQNLSNSGAVMPPPAIPPSKSSFPNDKTDWFASDAAKIAERHFGETAHPVVPQSPKILQAQPYRMFPRQANNSQIDVNQQKDELISSLDLMYPLPVHKSLIEKAFQLVDLGTISEVQFCNIHNEILVLKDQLDRMVENNNHRVERMKAKLEEYFLFLRLLIVFEMTRTTQLNYEQLEELRVSLMTQILGDEESSQAQLESLNQQVVSLMPGTPGMIPSPSIVAQPSANSSSSPIPTVPSALGFVSSSVLDTTSLPPQSSPSKSTSTILINSTPPTIMNPSPVLPISLNPPIVLAPNPIAPYIPALMPADLHLLSQMNPMNQAQFMGDSLAASVVAGSVPALPSFASTMALTTGSAPLSTPSILLHSEASLGRAQVEDGSIRMDHTPSVLPMQSYRVDSSNVFNVSNM